MAFTGQKKKSFLPKLTGRPFQASYDGCLVQHGKNRLVVLPSTSCIDMFGQAIDSTELFQPSCTSLSCAEKKNTQVNVAEESHNMLPKERFTLTIQSQHSEEQRDMWRKLSVF